MPESLNDLPALPPHRETFLARYPRKLKLSVLGAVLAAVLLISVWPQGSPDSGQQETGFFSFFSHAPEKKPDSLVKVDTDIHAPALNDQDDRSIKLTPAPDSRVSQDTADGTLPRISEYGLKPWQAYARPFNLSDKRPRIAVVITDLGLSEPMTEKVITQLPPTVTLSFSTMGAVVGAWGARARQEGHEFLIQLPVEPYDYPNSDPGPESLLTNLPNAENLARLSQAFQRATGYVGVTTTYGSTFTSDSTDFALILQALRDRGLLILDSRAAPHSVVTEMARNAKVPVATATLPLDANLAPDAIQAALAELEKTAAQNGRAVGVTAATPVMVNQLLAWMKTLPQKGIALAPLSAIVQERD